MTRRPGRAIAGALTVPLVVLTGLVLTVLMPASASAASVPSVDGQSASSITPFAATLEGQVNPQGETTTSCVFEYGKTTAYGETVNCEPETLEGEGDQGVTHRIEGLEAATTYHFRIKVADATGTTEGADGEFTTGAAEAPLVDGESFANVETEGAKLSAQVNPNWQETTYVFEYATNGAMTGATTVKPPAGTEPFPAGFADHEASVQAEGLTPGTRYFYRVVATNATGTTQGPVQSFTTVGPPLVASSGTASGATRTTVQLAGGSIDPVGAQVSYSYRYLTQAAFERGLAEDPSDPYANGASSLPTGTLAPGFGVQPAASVTLSELAPGTTYHFALEARNSAGTTVGPDATFTTMPATPPLASTGAAEAISAFSATITGSVQTRELPTSGQFEFGTTPALGSPVPATLTHGEVLTASAAFEGDLQPGTTYYYRLTATNADGTSHGATLSFTTPGLPVTSEAPLIRSLIPYLTLAQLEAKEPKTSGTGSRPLTKKQKLARALRACHRKHGHARKTCERQAKRRYT